MYARTTTIQADPSKIDEGIAHVRDQVIPAVTAITGCVGMSLLVDRESGRCIATTAWESEAAMNASAETVRPLRSQAEQVLGADTSDVDTWEIAALHRDHATPDGGCARVTWLSGDPKMADRAADVFRMAVLPRVQELEGFCSGSLLINRQTGRAVGTITFDSREHVEQSREAAGQIRERASSELAAAVDAVSEMEVALAHLHVPEMA
ncbi:MAG TPA: antibiotic biosynthesis monooxygenase [Nocardioidaceae bacterium]|nr:antibiotic biosynthesis monooxygenase [Nocardioidaceae bacterium]